MHWKRSSGILLHPTSLPSHGPIGDFGPAAFEFADWLAKAGQSIWQVLPLNPVGLGNSPYSAISAFAGNPSMISLQYLVDDGWLAKSELTRSPKPTCRIDFRAVAEWKMVLLRKSAENFLAGNSNTDHSLFEQFCRAQRTWLEDFVLFQCLRDRYHGASWNSWPQEIAKRDPQEIEKARHELTHEMQIQRALQFAFFTQWDAIHKYAAELGIRILGDIAIFVNYDSADVWSNPTLFKLDADRNPTVVAGVPPDSFSKTGQRWGNPVYRWDILRERGYDWWIERVRWNFALFDYLRLDHFRGFDQYWEIPALDETAINGTWVDGPRDELFKALRDALGERPLIAEDLGTINDHVLGLLDRLQLPGMKVLQFAFGEACGRNPYLPHNHTHRSVVYTGTHDNDTTNGWWKSLDKAAQSRVKKYFGIKSGSEVLSAMMRAAMTSVADVAIIPMQDVLGLGSEARMNTPSHTDGNWEWRMTGNVNVDTAIHLAEMAEISGRKHSN
jgi:4-alpha-glucanotransferase